MLLGGSAEMTDAQFDVIRDLLERISEQLEALRSAVDRLWAGQERR